MRTEQIPLADLSPGIQPTLTVHRFGASGARPADLHPGLAPCGRDPRHDRRASSARALDRARSRGTDRGRDRAGAVRQSRSAWRSGCSAVPVGRFDLANGRELQPRLSLPGVEGCGAGRGDADRRGRRQCAAHPGGLAWPSSTHGTPTTPAERAEEDAARHSRSRPMSCSTCIAMPRPSMHLYTRPRSADEFAPLCGAARLPCGCLVADESGDDPFDEACSRPWAELAASASRNTRSRWPAIATTLEFRGERDVEPRARGGRTRRPSSII